MVRCRSRALRPAAPRLLHSPAGAAAPAGCTHPDRGTTCRFVTRRPGNRKISIAGENRPDQPAPGHGRTSHSPFHRTGRIAPCSEQIGARRSLTHTGRTTTKGAGAGDGPPEAPAQLHERVAAGILGPSRPGHRLPQLALRHLPLQRVPPTAINVDGHIHAAGGPRKRHFNVSVEHTNYAPDGLSSVLDVARRTARTPRPRKRSRRRGTLADCGTGRGATSRSRPQTANRCGSTTYSLFPRSGDRSVQIERASGFCSIT